MKICLYYEFYHLIGEKMMKKIGGGVATSYENQKQMLREQNIKFAETWQDDCEILQVNFQGLSSLYLIKKAKKQNKKVIIWGHTIAENFENSIVFSNSLSPLIKKILIYFYNLADVVLCPSNYAKEVLLSYGIPREKLIVQTNGVDTKKFIKNQKLRLLGRKKYKIDKIAIGNASLVMPRKGIDTFTKLAKAFPKEKFFWYGKIYSPVMVNVQSTEIPSNLLYTDYLDHDKEMPKALNALDIFLFPSYEETQGISILEAAAVGLPIIVRDIPAYKGWLTHGINCFKARNNKEFKKYLSLLIKDEELRTKLGGNARKMAELEGISFQSKKILGIYKNLINLPCPK